MGFHANFLRTRKNTRKISEVQKTVPIAGDARLLARIIYFCFNGKQIEDLQPTVAGFMFQCPLLDKGNNNGKQSNTFNKGC